MNHRDAVARLAAQLRDEPGWEQAGSHCFRHAGTGVYVLVWASSVAVAFGPGEPGAYDKAVSASTSYFPATALAAVVEVAKALVFTRTAARYAEEATIAEITRWAGRDGSVRLTDDI